MPTTPTTLDQARAEALHATLAADAHGGHVRFWTLPELLDEFVTAQRWTRGELNAAIDTLAAAGSIELDGEDGQVLLTVLPEAPGLAPWQRAAA